MAIYETGTYQIKSSAIEKIKKAIREFVDHVQKNEPGTLLYLAWQDKNDPTKFVHSYIFADAEARTRHSKSEAVQMFESVYRPELVGNGVVFTDYEVIAEKLTSQEYVSD
jgi:quinol monooxygenase YgiN